MNRCRAMGAIGMVPVLLVIAGCSSGGNGPWKVVSAGFAHTCAIDTADALWCWGDNFFGQLGTGVSGSGSPDPVQEVTGSVWRAVFASSEGTCGVRADRTLWCWGWNNHGQVGDGTTIQRETPTQVGSDADWTTVAIHTGRTCGLKRDGSLFCWGYNLNGRLGDGTTQERHTPVAVAGPAIWRALTVGGSHTCGLRGRGSVWCWGNSRLGQRGDGTFDDATVPVRVGSPS